MLVRMRPVLALVAAAGLGLALLQSTGEARADAGFERWVASFRSTAAQSGISGKTFDRAFRGVTEPDQDPAPAWRSRRRLLS